MKKTLFFLLPLLLSLPSFPQKTSPDIVIVASLLSGEEDVGIAFSQTVPRERVESYLQSLAQLGGRMVEDIQINEEEGKTSAHFLLKGGKQWGDDKPYIQMFVNAFPDMDSLFIVLFPLRQIENTLPLHFENEDIIIKSSGVDSFNYEVRHKREMTSATSLYSAWEKWRLPLILAGIFTITMVISVVGRRKRRQ